MDRVSSDQAAEGLKTNIFTQYFKLVAMCWHYGREHRGKIILFHILFVIANIVWMSEPYVIGQIINRLQDGGEGMLDDVIFWLIIYASTSLVFWCFHGPARIIERTVGFHIYKAFNLRQFEILTRLPLRWHNDNHTGNTTNRVNKASLSLVTFAQTQFIGIQNLVHLIIIFTMIGYLNPAIALILFIMTVITFYVMTLFDKAIMKQVHQTNEKSHIYSSVFFDYVSNMANVLIFNMRKLTRRKLDEAISDYYPHISAEIRVNEYKWFVRSVAMVTIIFIALYGYITYHTSNNIPIMLGTLVMLFQYLMRLNAVFIAFASNYEQIVRYFTDISAVERIRTDYEKIGLEDDHEEKLVVNKGAIDVEGVGFSYANNKAVFEDFGLNIKAGERIGLVGSSGAGKTSLVHLLMRFYEPDSGRVLIDGQDIAKVSSHSLRDAIAVIPQDTTLFEVSLLDNIRYGRIDASDEEVHDAARRAYADEFIRDLPDGYDTLVGERGVKLSGGQRQRVAIARAILKDAPILILDEATSALDSESERYIQASLEEMMKGKTVIAIAHRLSTIASLDRLIVMKDGKRVEDGTHEELIKKDGLYSKLWSMQSGGFLKE